MQINYLIQAHRYPQQLARLVKRLYSEESYFYISIDKKSDIDSFKNELDCYPNVKFVKKRIDVIWGHISVVDNILNTVRQALSEGRKGYFVLLSGQDYPLKNNEYIHDYLVCDYGKNYITCRNPHELWGKEETARRMNRYNLFVYASERRKPLTITDIFDSYFWRPKAFKSFFLACLNGRSEPFRFLFAKRRFPAHLIPQCGSNWWALPHETVIWILSYLNDNPSYYEYHQYSLVPDEMVFTSLLKSKFGNETIADSLTYNNWERKGGVLPVTFQKTDLEELASQKNTLFARKFDMTMDSEILDLIDEHLIDGNRRI